MAVSSTPVFIQSGGETAELVRRLIAAILGGRGGVVGDADLAVTQNTTPDMSILVASGQVLIPGSLATYQGSYHLENRGSLNLALAASDPTNARKDLIVAKVEDAAYAGATNAASIVAVTGTASASPVEPAAPANSWVLAMVDVAAAATSITNANITDRRSTQAGQYGYAAGLRGVIRAASTARPAHAVGRLMYETDTALPRISDGAAWSSLMTAPLMTGSGSQRAHWGSYTGTTDASGYLTVTHGAPFTPTVVLASSNTLGGGPGPIVGTTTYTSTTFYTRISNIAAATGITVRYLCLA